MDEPNGFRLPDSTHRHIVVGRTGTGKSVLAVWLLSQRNWDEIPWIIIDYKGDKLIARIPAREIGFGTIPSEPGLYVIRPLPDQREEMDAFMMQVWERQNVGLFIDEAYMIGQHSAGFRTVLTQGRSLEIPVIALSQRPVKVDTFMLSEADFIQTFHLNGFRDRRTMEEYIPGVDMDAQLPEHTSWYYDVGKDKLFRFNPVPPPDKIIEIFHRRLQQAEAAGEPIPAPRTASFTRI